MRVVLPRLTPRPGWDAQRVLDDRGSPVDGLWAAGVDAGGIATGGYASGLAQTLVLGLAAADSAAGP